ncbi:MAG: hypothetical protein HQM10_08555 [Candidatus Riflebacteria bacterium]|nr:hypothetical protein [Candidatus Riflebacteria bacterium]
MKQFALIYVLLITFFTLFIPVSGFALNEWTVIVYLCGDDNKDASLEENHRKDLEEMARASSKPGLEVVVQADRGTKISEYLKQAYADPSYSGAKRYVVKNSSWETEAQLGEINTGSPYALWDMLKWVAAKHPAKHYCLIINGHGSGIYSWRGEGNVSAAVPGAVNFDPNRFVAYDSTDDDCLTVFEVQAVLEAFRARLNSGRKVDLIGFDACMAGMIEALYQLKESCQVMVANPSLTPGTGFDYDGIVSALGRNLAMTPEQLAEVITKTFIDSVHSNTDPQMLSAWRTDRVQELVFALNNLSMEMLKAIKLTGKKAGLSNMTTYGGSNLYWDIERILRAVQDRNTNWNGASNAQVIVNLAAEAQAALKAARVSMWYDGSFSANKVGGLSIAWPDPDKYKSYRNFYKALAFSKTTKWDEFLDARELNISE